MSTTIRCLTKGLAQWSGTKGHEMEATGNQMEPGPSDIKKNNNEMSKNNI